MSKALRLSEKRLHRGLWLVAIVFAWFLVGLGSLAGRSLTRAHKPLVLAGFPYPARVTPAANPPYPFMTKPT